MFWDLRHGCWPHAGAMGADSRSQRCKGTFQGCLSQAGWGREGAQMQATERAVRTSGNLGTGTDYGAQLPTGQRPQSPWVRKGLARGRGSVLLLSPSLLSHKRGWPERPCPSLPGSVQSCVYPDLDVLVERPAFPPAVCSLLSPPHHKGSVTQPSQVQRHHLLSATCREPQGEAPSALTPCGLQEGPERRWACVWTSPQPAWPGGSHGGSVSPLKAGQGHPVPLLSPVSHQQPSCSPWPWKGTA